MEIVDVAFDLFCKEQFQQAEAVYATAIDKNPGNPALYMFYGMSAYMGGNRKKGVWALFLSVHLGISDYMHERGLHFLDQNAKQEVFDDDMIVQYMIFLGTLVFHHQFQHKMKITFDVEKNMEQFKRKLVGKPFQMDNDFITKVMDTGYVCCRDFLQWDKMRLSTTDELTEACKYYAELVNFFESQMKAG